MKLGRWFQKKFPPLKRPNWLSCLPGRLEAWRLETASMPLPTGPTRRIGAACAPTASGWTPTDFASDYAAGSLIQSNGTPAHAQQAPYDKCVAVPKIQYDSAKSKTCWNTGLASM